MRPLAFVRTFLLMLSLLVALPWQASHAQLDREKMLNAPGVYATFTVFQLDRDWWQMSKPRRGEALKELRQVIAKHADKVVVDPYLLRGLTDRADLLLRIHGPELVDNQRFLVDFMASGFGHQLVVTQSWNALTKPLNYVPTMPEAVRNQLKGAVEPGPKRYGIVVPIKKDAAWWSSNKEIQAKLMMEHVEAAMPYLATVKRKLYHASGLSDVDFVTYFETNKLEDFNNLVLALMRAKENMHNRQFGPVILGTIGSLDEVMAAFAKAP